MPLYKYKCTKCDNVFTKILKFNEVDGIKCNKCSGDVDLLPPLSTEPTVRVLLDKKKNKSVMRGINKIMRKRSSDYHKKYEIGEVIEKVGLDSVIRTSKHFDKTTGRLKK